MYVFVLFACCSSLKTRCCMSRGQSETNLYWTSSLNYVFLHVSFKLKASSPHAWLHCALFVFDHQRRRMKYFGLESGGKKKKRRFDCIFSSWQEKSNCLCAQKSEVFFKEKHGNLQSRMAEWFELWKKEALRREPLQRQLLQLCARSDPTRERLKKGSDDPVRNLGNQDDTSAPPTATHAAASLPPAPVKRQILTPCIGPSQQREVVFVQRAQEREGRPEGERWERKAQTSFSPLCLRGSWLKKMEKKI